MKDKDTIISCFDSEAPHESAFSVDFSRAGQLKGLGSTCDIYEATVQRRRVFIKRLKAGFRSNPLYRAAFSKEYELGVTLSHPSLPRYVGYGADYIAMDFIEGDTLAELIKRNDRRLKDKKFGRKLIGELIEVVTYLHNRNIVHCDIKPDNIIISPYSDRPATLIDFDKAYSPWLDSTHGRPENYGCESCRDGDIDFKGIGMIAELFNLNQVVRVCNSGKVTAEKARKALKTFNRGGRRWRRALLIVAVICTVIAAFVILYRSSGQNKPEPTLSASPDSSTTLKDTVVYHEVPNKNYERVVEKIVKEASDETPSLPTVDDIVKHSFAKLKARQEYLLVLAADSTTSSKQLQLVITSYANDRDKAQNEIIEKVMERFGLTDPFEAHSALGTSHEWSRFMKQDSEISQLYYKEIKKREISGVNQQSPRQ